MLMRMCQKEFRQNFFKLPAQPKGQEKTDWHILDSFFPEAHMLGTKPQN